MADNRKLVISGIVIFILIIVGTFLLFRDTTKKTGPGAVEIAEKIAQNNGIAMQDKDKKDVKSLSRKSMKADFSKLTLEERANVNAALNYRQLKEKYKKRSEKKRKVKRAFYENGGSEIAMARKAMRENKSKNAINFLKEALKKAGNNQKVKETAYRYLAQNYEKTGEIPNYCVNMYKYLDLYEKSIKDDADTLEQVQLFKIKLKESIDKFDK